MTARFSSTTSTSSSPSAKRVMPSRFERPGHRDLIEPQPERRGLPLADAEFLHRLPDVEIGFSGRRRCRSAPAARSMTMRSSRLARAKASAAGTLEAVQPGFLVERRVGPADVETAGRHREILRHRRSRPAPDRPRSRPNCPSSRQRSSAPPSTRNSATSPSRRGRDRECPATPAGFSTGITRR